MKAYKYRIYPTNEQKIFFAKTFGCVRKVYNLMLCERIKNYETEKETGIKSKYPTPAKYKEEYSYLKEIDSLALANAQLNLQSSYAHFFRRLRENKGQLGFPKYKNKHHKQSYTTNNQNGTVKIVDDCWLKLPKFKTLIKLKKHRTFQGIIKSVTISKTPTEKYYASILVEQTKDMSVFETKNQDVLGIDLGLSHFAILSNGEKINNPKFLDNSLKLLKKEQRKLSRRKKRSVNRNKQRLIVAKAHEKISNKRNDFLHKVSTKIVNENQVSILAIENLNVKGMIKNKRLARHINDCGWGYFIELLNYKAKERNRKIQKVDRFFPSSKTCHCCGHKLDKLGLSIRSWKCPNCHTTHDRDINAAINLKNKIKADVFGTKMYVKSSSETILHSSSVSAKGISLKY